MTHFLREYQADYESKPKESGDKYRTNSGQNFPDAKNAL